MIRYFVHRAFPFLLRNRYAGESPTGEHDSLLVMKTLQNPSTSVTTSAIQQKRKRPQSDGPVAQHREHKRQKSYSTYTAPEGDSCTESIDFWRRHHVWPLRFFDLGPTMSQPSARKRSSSGRSSELPSQGMTCDLPRESKSNPYKDARYETFLTTAKAFMDNAPLKITDTCRGLLRRLLEAEQCTPIDTLFRNDLFKKTCSNIRNENEARLIKDITWLIVSSAETLAIHGATKLDILIEKVSLSWLK